MLTAMHVHTLTQISLKCVKEPSPLLNLYLSYNHKRGGVKRYIYQSTYEMNHINKDVDGDAYLHYDFHPLYLISRLSNLIRSRFI